MTNRELVVLVTEAYDAGFRDGYSFSGERAFKQDYMLTDLDYIVGRDAWVRARVPEQL